MSDRPLRDGHVGARDLIDRFNAIGKHKDELWRWYDTLERECREIEFLRAQLAAEQSGTAALRRELDHLRRDKQALRALVKEAFCEGAEGAPRPLNSDMESAWKHSESRELLESF